MVQLKDCDRDAPHGRAWDDLGSIKSKVLVPGLSARVEEWRQIARLWVERCEVRALCPVAERTGKSLIVRSSRAAVLLRDDVLNVEAEEGEIGGEATVLTTAFGAFGDFAPQSHRNV